MIAHEVGHHVQNLLGIDEKVRAAQQRGSEAQANQLSVRMELQADCLAGVWGHYVKARARPGKVTLEPGDVEEGLRAAAAIGDDAIQRKTQGQVSPESWTHGSSEQRVQWLRRGLDSPARSAPATRSDYCDGPLARAPERPLRSRLEDRRMRTRSLRRSSGPRLLAAALRPRPRPTGCARRPATRPSRCGRRS